MRQQLAELQSNIHSFAVPDNARTLERARGMKSDIECINEVCGLVANGMGAVEAVKQVQLPWSTWHSWVERNHLLAKERYALAYKMHLEIRADQTIKIYDDLLEERRIKRAEYFKDHDDWRAAEGKGPEPIYKGPTEWELTAAKARVNGLQVHIKAGLERFKDTSEVNHNITSKTTAVHEVTIKKDESPEDALRAYHKLIEGTKE